MRYLSLFSGVEAASLAWHPLGWEPVAFAEVEPFCKALLAHRFPGVPDLGDVTRWREWPAELLVEADVVVGGSPCQAFSVAGLRGSMGDARGNLTRTFVEVADAVDDLRRAAGRPPCIVVWENVPGVLSVPDDAFGCFLGGLCGGDAPVAHGRRRSGVVDGPVRRAAWRILDARWFGVPQRRRRVFVVAHGRARGWACADALLPLGEGLRGDPETRGDEGADVAGCLASGSRGSGRRVGADEAAAGQVVFGAGADSELAEVPTLSTKRRQDYDTEAFVLARCHGSNVGPAGTLRRGNGAVSGGVPFVFQTEQITHPDNRSNPKPGDPAPTLPANGHPPVLAFDARQDPCSSEDLARPCGAKDTGGGVLAGGLRRLLPVEVERLQGMPDDWTAIPWRGKPAPDGPRYRAVGNSMAVPVVAWIGRRIAAVCGEL